MKVSGVIPDHDRAPVLASKRAIGEAVCDLCGWPMPIPTICRERGEILGPLVCTACVEDQLEALVQ